MTGEAPVWWVDKCLEGFPQTGNQQLCQITSEQSSAKVSLDSAPISIFFKNSSDGVENKLFRRSYCSDTSKKDQGGKAPVLFFLK